MLQLRRLIPSIAVFLCFALNGFAQIGRTALSGIVTDSTGAAVPNATVTLVSEAMGFSRTAATNSAGVYSFPDLNPGVYDISAEASGFKKAVVQAVRLYVGISGVQDLTLQVGALTERVQVTATAPLLRQDTAEIGTIIEAKALTELPLNGRNFLQLNLLSPGATRSKNSNTFDDVQIDPTAQSFNVNGQRGDYNVYLLDGANIKEYQHGSNTFAPSVEAVQEFNQGSSNYSAAFGAEAGAQVNLITKSGTNQLHGSAFEFLRNNKLDARNFFEQSKSAPPFRRNQFGATMGGPVLLPGYNGKDKTFWFFSYEGFRESKDLPLLGNFPTMSQLEGDLSSVVTPDKPLIDPLSGQPFPDNRIPAERIPSTLLPFLKAGIGNGPWLPTPNSSTPGFNYFKDDTRKFARDQYLGRIDHRFNEKTFLYGRYAYNTADLTNPSLNQNFTFFQRNFTHSVSVHASRMFKPNVIGELTFGYSQFIQDEPATTVGKYDITNKILQIQGLSTTPSSWGAPGWGVTGYSGLGQGGSLPRKWKPTNFEFRPQVAWTAGRHNLRFGTDITRFLSTFQEIIGPNGDFGFDGRFSGYALGDFLLGYPSSSFFSPDPFNPETRYWQLAGYFQDDWKITSRLTLNFGLRYEYVGVPVSSNHTMANIYLPPGGQPTIVVPEKADGITFEGVKHELLTIVPYVKATSVGLPDSLVFADKKDWGPRFGFAYSLPGVRDTVVRGGYGIFYQRDTENKFVDMALNPPFVGNRDFTFDQTNFQQFDWFHPATLYNVSGVGLFGNDPYLKNGRIQAWNFSLDHTIGGTLVSAAYIGNTSHHLSNLEMPNQARPGPGSIASRRLWPDWGTVYVQSYNGNANYNGLQLKSQRSFQNGLTFLIGYTWSKTIDDTGGTFVGEGGRGFVFQDAYNHRADRGLAAQDIRHRFVASYVYELPFGRGKALANQSAVADAIVGGWSVNGVTSIQTGSPFTISQACNRANTDSGTMRPDVVGNWRLPGGRSSGEMVSRYFNTGAFLNVCPGVDGPFTFGNAGRNIVIGPGLQNWDFGLYKQFRLASESAALQFRAEVFNAFNHPNFGQPGRTAGTPQFGVISYTATDAREMQFALRLTF